MTQVDLFCVSDEELAAEVAALSPADRAALDALTKMPRESSVDTLRFYEQSKGQYDAALAVLRAVSNHLTYQMCEAPSASLLDARRIVDDAVPDRWDARRMPYTGPWPRKRHYHRCPKCKDHGGNGVNCYKSRCSAPVLLDGTCSWCR